MPLERCAKGRLAKIELKIHTIPYDFQIKDQNDSTPKFRHLESNMILNLCGKSLEKGMSGELFQATDSDLNQLINVRLIGLDFLKVVTTGMELATLLISV